MNTRKTKSKSIMSLFLALALILSIIAIPEIPVKAEESFTVTYDANGATAGTVPESSSVASGTAITIADNTGALEKTDCTFAGWNTSNDGNGTDYAPNDSMTVTGEVTLYAKFVPVTHGLASTQYVDDEEDGCHYIIYVDDQGVPYMDSSCSIRFMDGGVPVASASAITASIAKANSASKELHTDENKDNKCDKCTYQISNSINSKGFVVSLTYNANTIYRSSHSDKDSLEGYGDVNSFSSILSDLGITDTITSIVSDDASMKVLGDRFYVFNAFSGKTLTLNGTITINVNSTSMSNYSDGLKYLAERKELVLPVGQTLWLGEMFRYSGIPHVNGCVYPSNISVSEGSECASISGNSLTGVTPGAITFTVHLQTSGCYYWSTTSTDATCRIRVTDDVITFKDKYGDPIQLNVPGTITMPDYSGLPGFLGWSKNPDMSGDLYVAGQEYTISDKCNFYPVYSRTETSRYYDVKNPYTGTYSGFVNTPFTASNINKDLLNLDVWLYVKYDDGTTAVISESTQNLNTLIASWIEQEFSDSEHIDDDIKLTLTDSERKDIETITDPGSYYIKMNLFDEILYYVPISASAPSQYSEPIVTPKAEEYVIPVSNKNTVDVQAEITEGVAKINEITDTDLKDVIGDKKGQEEFEKTETVLIDLSKAKQDVNSVELTVNSVKKLADTTVDKSNPIGTVTIKLASTTVELDAKTLETLAESAAGDKINLVVDDTVFETTLNESQKKELQPYEVAKTFEAYFECNGSRIHDFKGGSAVVSIDFVAPAGKEDKYFHVYYVPVSGKAEKYATRVRNGKIQFTTTHFSDFAIVYDETDVNDTYKISENTLAAKLDLDEGLKVNQTGNALIAKWGKVSIADGYVVYVTYCGEKTFEKAKIITDPDITSVRIEKIHGKALNLSKNYKLYVVPYKNINGKRVRITRSIIAHVVGYKNTKNTNVKDIELANSSYSLEVGKSATIQASVVLVNPSKKQLPDSHTTEFRYASTDKKIATVTKDGKITAVGTGTCYIYVYAKNGYAKKVEVNVD